MLSQRGDDPAARDAATRLVTSAAARSRRVQERLVSVAASHEREALDIFDLLSAILGYTALIGRDVHSPDRVERSRRTIETATLDATYPVSASAFSNQYVMPMSRYIVVAVVRCSRACSRLSVRW